jgi:hypothetical protein
MTTDLQATEHTDLVTYFVNGEREQTYDRKRMVRAILSDAGFTPVENYQLGPAFEQAVADLKYGCVAINAWTGVGFLLTQTTWGAYPGHTPDNIQSGIGVVHNSKFFDKPQKSVVRAPFYPYPRSYAHGMFTLLPKPPWFVTNRKARVLGRQLVHFEAHPSAFRLPGIFVNALRG